nr:MAG TPA: hypothetical protein [Caudoviricetes sp.]
MIVSVKSSRIRIYCSITPINNERIFKITIY